MENGTVKQEREKNEKAKRWAQAITVLKALLDHRTEVLELCSDTDFEEFDKLIEVDDHIERAITALMEVNKLIQKNLTGERK